MEKVYSEQYKYISKLFKETSKTAKEYTYIIASYVKQLNLNLESFAYGWSYKAMIMTM